ncbi:MAG: hypothetical protein IJC29_02480 [Clostridia bacterium]|nr:hypothetical protein [Clostridia bacterium]
MFCHKKPTPGQTAMKITGIVLAAVGAMTVAGYVLSKCNCLGKRMKRLACKCDERIAETMKNIRDTVTGVAQGVTSATTPPEVGGPSARGGACDCVPESYHPTSFTDLGS